MAKTFKAPFVQTYGIAKCQITAAETVPFSDNTVAAPGNTVKLVDGSVEGVKVPYITVQATDTQGDFVLSIWWQDSSDALHCIMTVAIAGATASTTVAPTMDKIDLEDIVLVDGEALWVGSTVVTNPINISCPYASY